MSNKKFDFDPGHLSDQMKESAQQIWLAGLGAFAKNQEEGKKVFEKLVDDGLNLQKKTTQALHSKVSEATDKITAMASSLNHQTPTQWAPLEELFHTRVAKAMEKMGTPSSEAFQALEARVAELEKHLAAAKPATPAKRPTRATRSK
jgi:poly(hydroxyalkanoate) granule-associated protein